MPKSLFDKIWARHEVAPGLLYIDLHLVHEVTSPQAFEGLRMHGRTVRRPDRTLATADHNVPDRRQRRSRRGSRMSCRGCRSRRSSRNCAEFGIPLYSIGFRSPGDRPRDRSRARSYAAGNDDRLRRLAQPPTHGAFGAPRVRDRHQRGRARAGDPSA